VFAAAFGSQRLEARTEQGPGFFPFSKLLRKTNRFCGLSLWVSDTAFFAGRRAALAGSAENAIRPIVCRNLQQIRTLQEIVRTGDCDFDHSLSMGPPNTIVL